MILESKEQTMVRLEGGRQLLTKCTGVIHKCSICNPVNYVPTDVAVTPIFYTSPIIDADYNTSELVSDQSISWYSRL